MKMVMTKSRSMFLSGFFHNFFLPCGQIEHYYWQKKYREAYMYDRWCHETMQAWIP